MSVKWTRAVSTRLLGRTGVQFGVEDWQSPLSYSNTWGSDSTETVQFYRDPFGRVYLKGRANRGTPVGALTTEIIFTLPEGYRPRQEVRFPVVDGANGASVAAAVRIATDGSVRSMVRAGTSDQNLSFDGISFRVPVDDKDSR